MNSNTLGFRNDLVGTRKATDNNDYNIGFVEYEDNRNQIVKYNPDLNYNPATQTLTVPNLTANITPQKTTWSYSQQDQKEMYCTQTYGSNVNTPYPISSLRASINPEGTKSIKINVMITCEFIVSTNNYNSMFYLNRYTDPDKGNLTTPLRSSNPLPGSDPVALGIAVPTITYFYEDNTTMEVCRYTYIDTPPFTFSSTIPTELKYEVMINENIPRGLTLNQVIANSGSAEKEAGCSSIIVEEINHDFEKTQTDALYTIAGYLESGEYGYWHTFSPLNVNITPVKSSHRLKITCCIMGEFGSADPHNAMFFLKRVIGSTTTYLRTSNPASYTGPLGIVCPRISYQLNNDTTPEGIFFEFVDDDHNTTNNITYTPMLVASSNVVFRLNSTANTAGASGRERGLSNIIVEDLDSVSTNWNYYKTDEVITYTPTGQLVPTLIGLSTTITPTSTKSYIKITATIIGEFTNVSLPFNSIFYLQRTSSTGTTYLRANTYDQLFNSNHPVGITPASISYHSNAGSTLENCNLQWIDHPEETNLLTYSVVFEVGNGYTGSFKKNGTITTYLGEAGVSTIIVEEMPSV